MNKEIKSNNCRIPTGSSSGSQTFNDGRFLYSSNMSSRRNISPNSASGSKSYSPDTPRPPDPSEIPKPISLLSLLRRGKGI